MNIDSYQTPDAEGLLRSAQERHADGGHGRRILITEAVAAGVFLAAAAGVAVFGSSTRSLSLSALAAVAMVYLVAARVRFPVGSAWTAPTQLVFVPMLFMLPLPLVPLIVAALTVSDLWSDAVWRRLSVTRVLAAVADSSYSLGPVLVLMLAGEQDFRWENWPLLMLAFGAQIVCDCAAGLGRTWFAERIRPSQQSQMVWLYLTDASLACAGLVIAASAVQRPGLVLLSLPLMLLLWLSARERKQRLDGTLALSTAYRGTALLLGDVIDAVDHYTAIHSHEVVDLSLALAQALELDAPRRRNVEFAALLHDVGKIHIPREIIRKPGKLDAAEWRIMRGHTVEGETMLKHIGGTLAGVGRFVRSSHERYDGQGYPDGLAGEEIPIESRIVSVCDAYNAMTTERPYSAARLEADAISELRRCAGSQFDPNVVSAMDQLLCSRIRSDPEPLVEGEYACPRG
jgi:HD-GYP domain-containing protein (c-di-GMP phosphodiesterase class II)